jgi:hypothetical protein
MSDFAESLQAGFDVLEDQAGELITFKFGSGEIQNLLAIPGKRKSQIDSLGKQIIANRDMDWLVRKDRMVFNDQPIVPVKGNLITTKAGKRYRVAAPQGGMEWEWSDQHETYYRIHTVAHKDE